MTVMECARRRLDKDWEGIQEIDIVTLGLGLIVVEATCK